MNLLVTIFCILNNYAYYWAICLLTTSRVFSTMHHYKCRILGSINYTCECRWGPHKCPLCSDVQEKTTTTHTMKVRDRIDAIQSRLSLINEDDSTATRPQFKRGNSDLVTLNREVFDEFGEISYDMNHHLGGGIIVQRHEHHHGDESVDEEEEDLETSSQEEDESFEGEDNFLDF